VTTADHLIERLEGAQETGSNRWIARCPGHNDRTPSLAIRQLDDGRVLVHCFAGCGTADVLAAVGLSLSDLFPKRYGHHFEPARDRRHLHAAREALRCLQLEVLVVALAAETIAKGLELDDIDRERLFAAARAIRHAAEVTT